MGLGKFFGQNRAEREQLKQRVLDYILLPEDQVEAYLQAHGDALLSDEAEKIFEQLEKEAKNDPATQLLIQTRHSQLMQILVGEMPELMPDWVENQNALADQLTESPPNTDEWQRGIALYEETLNALDPMKNPYEWGLTSSDLGRAYQLAELPGDRGILAWALKDKAIQTFVEALLGWTRDRYPEEWAKTQLNLGLTFMTRPRGNRWDNLKSAILHFKCAAEVITRTNMPVDWAIIQSGLGLAYVEEHADLEPAEAIEAAITYFKNALNVRDKVNNPETWADLQYYLGNAYLKRTKGDHAENIERAMQFFQSALQVLGQGEPLLGQLARLGMGKTYAQRLRGSPNENLRSAQAAFNAALEGVDPEEDPGSVLMVESERGQLLFTRQRWNEASGSYQAALAAQELLYESGASTAARHNWLRAYNDLQVNAAYCLARQGRFTEAVLAIEKGKARALGEALARNEAALELARHQDRVEFITARRRLTELEAQARQEEVTTEEQEDIADELRVARDARTVQQIYQKMLAEAEKPDQTRPSEIEISAGIYEARDNLQEVVGRIQTYAPGFMQSQVDYPSLANLASGLGFPLVYLVVTAAGSLALVIEPGARTLAGRHAVWLDAFDEKALSQSMHFQREDQPYYLEGITSPEGISKLPGVLDAIWPGLQERLVGPLVERLGQLGYRRAALLPGVTLGLFPLAAVAFDQCMFTYAPSARALQFAWQNAQERRDKSPILLGVGNPANAMNALPFARYEVEQAAALFPTSGRRCFYEGQAKRTAVVQALPGATHLHFACHGKFDLGYELDSALALAGQDKLTLRDMLDGDLDLSSAQMAVLSACQSGLADVIKAPEEAVGFPAGFLQAGVPAVVSTLWPISDLSTALLVRNFYQNHITRRCEPAAALQMAQDQLRRGTVQQLGLAEAFEALYNASGQRDAQALRSMRYYRANPQLKPFEHPYHWGGFILTGAG